MKDRQELVDLGLGDVTHTRLNSVGQKPGITTKEILVRTKNSESKFVPAVRKPKDYEIKQDQKSIDAILKRPYDLEVLVPHVCLMIFDFDLQTNVNPSN